MKRTLLLTLSALLLFSIETYANQHLLTEGADVASLSSQMGIPGDALSKALLSASLKTPPYYANRLGGNGVADIVVNGKNCRAKCSSVCTIKSTT